MEAPGQPHAQPQPQPRPQPQPQQPQPQQPQRQAEPRPLGLGILAVASFALALYNVQSATMLIIRLAGKLAMPDQPQLAVAYYALPLWLCWFLLAAAAIKVAFLVLAGIGYFRQKRIGRVFGSAYAVVSIAESIVAAATVAGVHAETVIGVLFPVYVLLAVNGMYRRNLLA